PQRLRDLSLLADVVSGQQETRVLGQIASTLVRGNRRKETGAGGQSRVWGHFGRKLVAGQPVAHLFETAPARQQRSISLLPQYQQNHNTTRRSLQRSQP